ncbi:MAG: nitrogen fixation protein NifH, partial [Lachnospiraceae bacterium]|nr:nitrogen fixation protein NifH [Lachnospiraceae bacterium]
NERKLEDEDERVRRFADAVGLPVLVKVPRSEVFARAEEENCTVMELDGAEREKNVFNTLADLLINGMTLYPANPLSDEDHERIVLGKGEKSVPKAAEADGKPSGAADADELPCEAAFPETEKSYTNRRPLYGCAFNGAASFAVHLTDAIVIAHGPKACAFYTMQTISSPGKRNIFNRGVLLPSSISPNFVSTDISHSEAVFGGMDLLKDAVKKAMEQKPGAVIVVSTCVAGIIGDDLKAVEEMSTDDIPVIAITADGDMNGDYMEGLRMAQEIIVSRLADRNVPKEDKCVNIIGEAGIVTNKGSNFAVMERLLKGMGIRVNCRFLGDATAQEVKGLCKARLNILAAESADAYQLKEYLVKEFGCEFLEEPLPIGFEATKNWVMAIGRFFGCEEEAARIVEAERKDYEERVANLKKHLEGKKIFLTTINTNIDWLLDTAFDAGMTFAHIGVYNYLRTPLNVTKHPERMNIVEETLDAGKTRQLIKELDPDIILSAYASGNSDDHAVIDVLPMVPDLGVMSAVLIMERWIRLMQTKRKGEWERDRVLFEKYFR